jgi:DNA/RNA-binding domain of Phe-tRNA-synthetase-like protein
MAHTDPCPTCAMIQGILMAKGVSPSTAHEVAYSKPVRRAEKKVKRKVGKYQKVFGKKLKALKRKHPRTAASALMKRAHRETKKAMR